MDRRKLEVEAEWERHCRRMAKPMPRISAPLPFEEVFTVEESARLQRSVLPQAMEDKWLVLYDEDTFVLRFHRSWTGFQLFAVTLVEMEPDDEGPLQFCATDATVNRDPEQYLAGDDDFEAARLNWLIRTLLLHQEVELPVDPSLSDDDAVLAAWSFAGGAGFAAPDDETTVPEDGGAPPVPADPTPDGDARPGDEPPPDPPSDPPSDPIVGRGGASA